MGVKCKKFDVSLQNSNPNLFDTSQWGSELKVSIWYMVYRVLMAVLFVILVTLYGVNTTLGGKWFIFMTNQGVALLTVSYVLEAALVLYRWCWELTNPNQVFHKKQELNWIYKISWFFSTTFVDVASFITIVYWVALHPFVVKNHLLKTDLAVGLNFFVHGCNTISCFIDVWTKRRPINFWHFIFPITYGLAYMFFSVIYWAAGGTGPSRLITPGAKIPDEAVISQDGRYYSLPYIYPILDWGYHPWIAVALVAIGVVALPLIHLIWMGLVKVRTIIFNHTTWNNSYLQGGPTPSSSPQSSPLTDGDLPL